MFRNCMKIRYIMSLVFLLGGLLFGIILVVFNSFSVETAFAQQNLIRLHVIANSNRPKDQNLKLEVRDAVLKETGQIFKEIDSKEQAQTLLIQHQDKIRKIAQEAVWTRGYSYPVEVKIGQFPFPPKTYGDLSLPEGYYDAIRIEIGEAVGDNWWCVLFPPLCLADLEGAEAELVNINEKNYDPQSGPKLAFRLKLWERINQTRYAQRIQQWLKASAASFTYLSE